MKKLFSLALAAAMALSMLTGCGGNSGNANDTNGSDAQGSQAGQTEQLSGVVNTNGSTSMEKVMQVLIEAFQEQQPNVTVNYTGSGSGAGVTSAIDGTADLGLASRALKSEEESKGAQAHIVALDGVAIVVNPENTVEDLTVDEIAQIFKGEITNWKDLGAFWWMWPICAPPCGSTAWAGSRNSCARCCCPAAACPSRASPLPGPTPWASCLPPGVWPRQPSWGPSWPIREREP